MLWRLRSQTPKTRRVFIALLGLTPVWLFPLATPECRAQQPQPPTMKRGSLAWRANEAKRNGKVSITMPLPHALVAELTSLDDATAHTSLVLATLVATESIHDEYGIFSWSKYKILEKLSQQLIITNNPLPDSVPASLLPLAPDEFLVPSLGGKVTIDGVTITMRDPDLHIPDGQNRHLMFVILGSSGSLAVLNYGPLGAFYVDDSDMIHPWIDTDTNQLRSDLIQRAGGRLTALRAITSGISSQPSNK